ncbi:MAG: hypothetical protein ACYC96_14085 [Fimbriimonadaceae bacterium]
MHWANLTGQPGFIDSLIDDMVKLYDAVKAYLLEAVKHAESEQISLAASALEEAITGESLGS